MNPMSAYGVVHYLLRKIQGPAREHLCVDCQAPAIHWAYDQCDTFERFDPETGEVFSVNFDHYQPMCGRCHHFLDAANVERLKLAFAEFQTRRAQADELAVA